MRLIFSHSIQIGSETFQSSDQSRMINLHANASLSTPVNICRFALTHPEDLKVKPDDPVEVELGYEGDNHKIFTGIVASVNWKIDQVIVEAVSTAKNLVATRHNQTFEKSKAGDIVSALCGHAEVPTATVDTGLEFAIYTVGSGASFFHHLTHLAHQCGCDLYTDVDDKLVFTPYSPASTHTFTYGLHILEYASKAPLNSLAGVEVYGSSPASHGEGAESSSWLTKKEVKGSAGSTSGRVIRMFDPTARTQENAAQISEAQLARHTAKKQGVLTIIGDATVKLGNAVEVKDMPASSQNGTYKITGVTHRIQPKTGFVTIINIEEN